MPLPLDKAPDTPSRMRQPKAKPIDENASDVNIASKRPAVENTAPPAKRVISGTATAAPKVNSLANPRTAASIKPLVQKRTEVASTVRQPDWSMNARLDDIERMMKEMQEQSGTIGNSAIVTAQLQLTEAKIVELQNTRTLLEERLSRKDGEVRDINEELGTAKRKIKTLEEEHDATMNRLKSSLSVDFDAMTRERDGLKREIINLVAQLDVASKETSALRLTLATQSATILELEGQLSAFRSKLESSNGEINAKEAQLLNAAKQILRLQEEAEERKKKLHEGETARRKLHNDLQELKGNIRVFCRVRPLLPAESSDPKSNVKVPGGHAIGEPEDVIVEQAMEGATGNQSAKSFLFAFDRVFGSEADQSVVFDEVSQLVQSALDGFRVCIFAYGQTGSGKTFTMEGGKDAPGVIPRAVEQVFLAADRLGERGWSFQMEASFLEIYNETIRDLLSEKGDTNASHEIRHTGTRTIITDLNVVPVNGPHRVLALLQLAVKNRAVAETQCNDRSSRSHSVFTLRISGINSVTEEKVDGILNLIDLAGSERLASSGSTGERLKETQAINKSLSALGDVIAALAAKESHIPYRNSKLTYLLQNSLGGNCKTLMFVNVSPAPTSIPETLCSLRFATKVNSCHIGQARRNVSK